MCNGFGMIISSEIKGYFTKPDMDGDISHTDILKALGWKENTDPILRRFVRIECSDWTMDTFRFDEENTLPGWAEDHTEKIVEIVRSTLSKAQPAYAEYKRICEPAEAEYKRIRETAEAEYKRICEPAYAEYNRIRKTAEAEFISSLSKITGYVC